MVACWVQWMYLTVLRRFVYDASRRFCCLDARVHVSELYIRIGSLDALKRFGAVWDLDPYESGKNNIKYVICVMYFVLMARARQSRVFEQTQFSVELVPTTPATHKQ